MSALHWFVSVGFTQQPFPAVFCFVLLNRDLVFLTAGLWEGLGWTGVTSKRCVLSPPRQPLTKRRDLSFITGFIKGLKRMDGRIKSPVDCGGCGDKELPLED